MKVLDDYACASCKTTEEHLVENGTLTVVCPTCGATATKQRRPIRAKLDHTFPGEVDKWAKRREQKLKQEMAHSSYDGSHNQ